LIITSVTTNYKRNFVGNSEFIRYTSMNQDGSRDEEMADAEPPESTPNGEEESVESDDETDEDGDVPVNGADPRTPNKRRRNVDAEPNTPSKWLGRRKRRAKYEEDKDVTLPRVTDFDAPDGIAEVVEKQADAHAERLYWTFRIENLENTRFEFIVVDEGQVAKNIVGAYHNTIKLLDANHLVWVTGTILYSSLQDVLSPMIIAWKYGEYEWEPNTDNIGDPRGLYCPQYDPTIAVNKLPGNLTTRGILHDVDEKNEDATLVKFLEGWKKGLRLWVLCPKMYQMTGKEASWSTEFASTITRAVLREFMIRRTASSYMKLPDGSSHFVGAGRPPCKVYLEELAYDRMDHTVASRLSKQLAAELAIHNDAEMTTEAGGNIGAKATLNFGTMRTGIMAATDLRHLEMLSKPPPFRGTTREIRDKIRSMHTGAVLTKSQKAREAKKDAPVLGAAHTNAVADKDPLGGLGHFYQEVHVDPAIPVLTHPAALLHWFISGSPLNTRLTELLLEKVLRKKQRVTIFTELPWLQQ
jgi:hypothetical protein